MVKFTTEDTSCPTCGTKMVYRALVDSDERIYSKWLDCLACGQRFTAAEPAAEPKT